jgi:hypothetical protein
MSALPWDAAARTTLRAANALFAAGSFPWLESLFPKLFENPSTRFESLLRTSMHDGADPHPAGNQALSGHMVPTVQRLGAQVPGTSTRGTVNIPPPASAPPSVAPTHPRPEQRFNSPGVVRDVQPVLSPPPPTKTRRGAASSTLASIPIALVSDLVQASPLSPAIRPSIGWGGRHVSTEPSPFIDEQAHLAQPSEAVNPIPMDRRPPPKGKAELTPSGVPQMSELSPHTSGTSPRSVETTRLVSSHPQINGLLQSAVRECHTRQESHSDTAVNPVRTLPTTDFATTAEPMRALPTMDALAEDMLVDRLADRIEERLREQALRHFGFTGGLT